MDLRPIMEAVRNWVSTVSEVSEVCSSHKIAIEGIVDSRAMDSLAGCLNLEYLMNIE